MYFSARVLLRAPFHKRPIFKQKGTRNAVEYPRTKSIFRRKKHNYSKSCNKSESPASAMDMSETWKNLPHAVPRSLFVPW